MIRTQTPWSIAAATGLFFWAALDQAAPLLAAEPGDPIARIAIAVEGAGHAVPPVEKLHAACDADALCVARFLRDRIGDGAELVPSEQPVSARGSWQHKSPAIGRTVRADGALIVEILSFDADALIAALNAEDYAGGPLVLDFRTFDGDDNLDAMRRTLAPFTGRLDRAFTVRHATGRLVDWTVQTPRRSLPAPKSLTIRLGPGNEAIVAVFAALARTHAGAELHGEPTRGSDFIRTKIPVVPGWALRVPTGQLILPGVDLAVGIKPDRPLPPN